ncbi:MAG: AMP-binding protein [Candidatus Cloacimonetes bacterium]|nr:AMP-binding protein [Candidatus Cloacimonadota bacterium]MDY0299073.1 AMP-binding protein [Candidatus Cloacimonadaceae bacterium]MCB5279757.1 AMP-binding protein [Candidatus Cloacimonadota bacterium]MCK9331730.1 AMP-binding protein [Candidatus Cloacimonadota bacterium]MDD2210257.1 AMP-binding protein [Candidatus Cloacimonadota bacterium]
MIQLEKFTLKVMIEQTIANHPSRPALSMVDGKPISYEQLGEQINDVIVMLKDYGIQKGDKVALLSQNLPNWGVAYLAIASMGAIVVPILVDFHLNEIHQILRHSGAKAVFVSNIHYEKIGYSDLDPSPMMFLMDNLTPIEPNMSKDKLGEFIQERKSAWKKFRNKALESVGLVDSEPAEDEIAAIIYTSGTTGSSKGVMLTHRNLVMDAWLTLHIQNVDEHDRLISILPLSHTYECTIGFIIPMMTGACVYYLDKPPTARILIPAMQKIKPTMILTVPLIIEKIFKLQIYPQLTKNLLMRELYKLVPTRKALHKLAGKKLMKTFGGALHFFGIGGALLSHDVERFLSDASFPYAIGYGLTETSPLIAGSSPAAAKFRSTGTVLPQLEVRIANPDPKTKVGEIQVKGPTIMKGYYKDKQRTDEAFTDDGFFKTGDLGVLNKKNYLYIKGRIKNVIIGPNGDNIYAEEIEAKLNEAESVLESMVYESGGNIIARVFLNYEILDAHYNLSKMGSVQAEKSIEKHLLELRTHLNANVASFSKLHKIIEQKEPFEKTPTQKIKRFLYQ